MYYYYNVIAMKSANDCWALKQLLFMFDCRVEGPDAKKTTCYDIDVEVVRSVKSFSIHCIDCRWSCVCPQCTNLDKVLRNTGVAGKLFIAADYLHLLQITCTGCRLPAHAADYLHRL